MRAKKKQRQLTESEGGPLSSPNVLASAAAGGASKRSINRWENVKLSDEAVDDRLSRRGRHKLVSEEKDMLMVGFFIDCRLNFLSVSREKVIAFAKDYLGVTPRPQYISELLAKHGITLQTAKARSSRLTDEKVVDDAIATLLEIRALGFEPDCIIILDETGLWSNVYDPRTYHFKNWCAGAETLSYWHFLISCFS
jgi:hypothetical protein